MNAVSTTSTPTQRTIKPVTPITIAAAANHIGLTPWDVKQMAVRGDLESVMLNGRRFVSLEDVKALIARAVQA